MIFVAHSVAGILPAICYPRSETERKMETYDLLMLAVLALTTVHGLFKGLAYQIASLGAIALGYFASLKFSEPLAPMFGQPPLNRFVAMFVLYMVASLAVWIGFRFVSDFLNNLQLRGYDRQVGGLFGAAKGVVYCLVVTFFALTLAPSFQEQILQSRSGHYMAQLLNRADPILPAEWRQVVEPYLNQLENDLAPDGAKPRATAVPARVNAPPPAAPAPKRRSVYTT